MNNKKIALGILGTSLLLATACGPKEQESNNVPSETSQEEKKVQEVTYMDVWTHIGKKGVDKVLPKDFKAIEDVEKTELDDGTTDYIYSFKDGVLHFVVKEDAGGEESVILLNLKKIVDGALEEEGFDFINLEKDEDEDEDKDIPLKNKDDDDDEDETDDEDEKNVEEESNEDEDNTEEEEEIEEEENSENKDDTEENEDTESSEETEETKDKKEKDNKKDDKDTKKDKSDEKKDDKKAEKKKPLDKKEGEKALAKAKDYIKMMHMSRKRLEEQLSSKHGEGFSEAAVQYAIENLKVDWKENALKKAKYYKEDMEMSDKEIKEQLISKNGEAFTEEEAEYAIKHLNN